MNTIYTELKSIYHFRTAFAVIDEYFPEELEKLTDDQRAELDSLDDYEDFGYTVVNGDTMIMDSDGNIIAVEPLQDFMQETLDYVRENTEDADDDGDEPADEDYGSDEAMIRDYATSWSGFKWYANYIIRNGLYDAAVNLMDDDIREDMHRGLQYNTEEAFLMEYLYRHAEKFHEPFVVN